MTTLIYWFRSDLRLHDNPALRRACETASRLLPLFIHDIRLEVPTRWGFRRQGPHRRHFLERAVASLDHELQSRGSRLAVVHGSPVDILIRLAKDTDAAGILCEAIAAPEEEAQIEAIRSSGIRIDTVWQSMLLPAGQLPFPDAEVPDLFTNFRQIVERARMRPEAARPEPDRIPPLPDVFPPVTSVTPHATERVIEDARSSFPYWRSSHTGGERAGLAHLACYFASDLPVRYKQTRNQLTGLDYSTKFSPWLASGALSPRRIYEALAQHEASRGQSDGSYWIWFELLWRDHFRLLHLKHGPRLYSAGGLRRSARATSGHFDQKSSERSSCRAQGRASPSPPPEGVKEAWGGRALDSGRPQGRASPSPPPVGVKEAWGGPTLDSGRPQGRASPSPPPVGVKEAWGGPTLPSDRNLADWCAGQTGEPLVDAGMRELLATGYLSNRLRQIVASFLIHDLNTDWRAGAAWFETCLLDYDVYSNQGNWLYIAGLGTDPRGGRRFDPAKQAREHDPDGKYRALWACS